MGSPARTRPILTDVFCKLYALVLDFGIIRQAKKQYRLNKGEIA